MLKSFLRSLFFTYVSFYLVNSFLNVLSLDAREYTIFILGLSVFHMSVKSVLNLVGLPSAGISLFGIKSVLIFVLLMFQSELILNNLKLIVFIISLSDTPIPLPTLNTLSLMTLSKRILVASIMSFI